MEEFKLSDDVIEQIKGFNHLELTDEQELLIDKLILKEELKEHCVTRCFGITKDPESNNFMVVMEYAKKGSLRQYLNNIFNSIKWVDKLDILKRFALGLRAIHEKELIHRDFHCGNMLQDDDFTIITDLGLCRPANVKLSQNEYEKQVYGVLPYVAPEVLRGKEYTQESDIYAFGIIAYEQVEEAERINEKFTPTSLPYSGTTLSYTTNPQAVYTSRLLNFKNLPEPKNAIDNNDDGNSIGEYSGKFPESNFEHVMLQRERKGYQKEIITSNIVEMSLEDVGGDGKKVLLKKVSEKIIPNLTEFLLAWSENDGRPDVPYIMKSAVISTEFYRNAECPVTNLTIY
ncbi:kinase-like domain-containing protein [Rhizophagus diaphanus]|nr:kinase-like domain-containing protein [Rhizophagus diaphanus] [Rhizophagus sp. MUCL 43196]